MSEIVVAILQKAIVPKGALTSWKMDQILGMDFPALSNVAVLKWTKFLTEGEPDPLGVGGLHMQRLRRWS